MSKENLDSQKTKISFKKFKEQILEDYKLACLSRETSLLGRKEVLTGKAKFGIFGDGKEIAQIALAKQFQNGDFRSGYYRDQTFMMAIGQLEVQEYFAGLYAHPDLEYDKQSAGRQMGGHFATRNLNKKGEWKNLMEQKNSSSDISPTAGQMARLVGLAQASKIYRNNTELQKIEEFKKFSFKGNEVAFGTIGDASTSEGVFWEAINAAGVLQIPMVISVWDDGYGISVPKKYQTTKESISEALKGFQRSENKKGIEIFITKGWDYPHLCQTYQNAVKLAREEHVPVLVHVKEVNQPQGHSTSGSHERYKNKKRLEWEENYDCISKFKEWILNYKIENKKLANEEELIKISDDAKEEVKKSKNKAWQSFLNPLKEELEVVKLLIKNLFDESSNTSVQEIFETLCKEMNPGRKEILSALRKCLICTRNKNYTSKKIISDWLKQAKEENNERYSSHLYSQSNFNALNAKVVFPEYNNDRKEDGRIILRDNFDKLFGKYPELLTFGEDTGKIGGVNQTMEGMQEKYGKSRVSDTGIRELTIVGQGIGMAMRGLRPIAEIQYLDYLLYCIQIMSDDLATIQYRTKGGQKAPLIIRTRGHRLEGIWHSGSPMGMIINSIRGMYVCVPRNLTKAAGFYNTLLKSDDAALVIEPLNGYRTKEKYPSNIGEFNEPLGIPEITKEGNDITLVSYGSTFNLCTIAVSELEKIGISVELIDAQTLIPFDINHKISESIKKTNRLMIVDEDVSSGATAYILDKILTEQNAFNHLDSAPVTISSKDHRPAYGSDGDYFSKPNVDDIIEKAYEIMNEFNPSQFPSLY